MNDDNSLTDDQLRLATSRCLPPDPELDSDTASARDAFMSLGSAAESAAGKFDEAQLLARLSKSCLVAPTVSPKPAELRRDWLSLVLAGALAAAALVAIVRITTDSSASKLPSVAAVSPTETAPVAKESRPAPWSLAWNDSLDDEIALASATLQQYTSRDRGFDGSLLDMNDRLEALSQELSNETL